MIAYIVALFMLIAHPLDAGGAPMSAPVVHPLDAGGAPMPAPVVPLDAGGAPMG